MLSEARRHEQRSDRAERSQLREPPGALPDRSARRSDSLGLLGAVVSVFGVAAGAAGAPTQYVPGRSGGWPAWLYGPLHGLELGIGSSSFQALTLVDVRELCGGAARRAGAPGQGDRRGDRGGERGAAAGAAADLPGRVRLPVVCATGRAAWPGPIYACGRRSAHRRRVCVHRVVVSALPLRPAVYARHLSARAARSGGWPVGAEGGRGGLQPGRGSADCARRGEDGTLGEVGGSIRGLEPGDARAGGGGSAQRCARAAGARGRAAAHGECLDDGRVEGRRLGGGGVEGRRDFQFSRRRGAACGRRGREGIRRAGAAVRGARATPNERACAGGGERRGRARVACDRGRRGLWRACVWLC